jgi:hypothetical protein
MGMRVHTLKDREYEFRYKSTFEKVEMHLINEHLCMVLGGKKLGNLAVRSTVKALENG